MLTETWLRDGLFNRELFDDRYEVFRRDRSEDSSSKSDGGGVCVAVKKSRHFTIIHQNDWQTNNVEDIWVTLKPTNNIPSVHINCVYLPGDTEVEKFNFYAQNISSRVNAQSSDIFIIVGDFNVPCFSNAPQNYQSNKASTLNEMMEISNLDQLNTIRSAADSNNLLDLVFSNRFLTINACDDPIIKVDVYHPPITLEMNIMFAATAATGTKFRNFKRVQWRSLNDSLMSVNWPLVFIESENVDEMVDKFYEIVYQMLDNYCPERMSKQKSHPCWFTDHTKKLIIKKRAYHEKWKLYRNRTDYQLFSKLRADTKLSISKDFEAFNRDVELNIRENPRFFWKHVNSKREDSAGVSEYVKLNEKVAYNREESANLFAEHFSSVYTTDGSYANVTDSSDGAWNEIFIPMSIVLKKLKELDVKKASGPDKLPPIFFRNCATALVFPLFTIFNKSMRTGIFPTCWKLAHVIPIYKEGSTHDAKNYRPISKLSIAAKVFDNIIADELFENFEKVIITQQHGFFKKRSTVTNLINYTESLQKCLDSAGQSDVIYTDFSKAFDRVSHKKLLEKLHSSGIGGKLLDWFQSYITGRTQRVQIGECLSYLINVSSSVVQGSHLGPLLFSIFINDIGEILHNVDFCIYADDLKIYKSISNDSDAKVLQENLDRLDLYVQQNSLSLNVKKCVVMSYTKRINCINFPYNINGNILERRDTMRDLGVIYDSKINFNEHVENVCRKARRMLGFMMRVGKHFRDPRTFTCLYNSLVRSHVEYASVIWNPHSAQQKLKVERVQHKFLRFVSMKCFGAIASDAINYADVEERLKLDTLELRRDIIDIKFTTKSFNDYIDGQTFLHNFTLAQQRITRSKYVFEVKVSRTDLGKYSVINRLMTTFNKYREDNTWLKTQPDDHQLKQHIRTEFVVHQTRN